MIIPFSEWRPDLPELSSEGERTALNVYPVPGGYGPMKSLSSASSALPAACVGAFAFTDSAGTEHIFAGTNGGLYKLNGSSWSDISDGSYTSPFWRFAQYANLMVATNGSLTKKFDVTGDTQVSTLVGAPAGAFLFGFLSSLAVVGGSVAVRVSQQADAEKWTVDCGSASQILYDYGPVTGGIGGEVAYIFQERGIRRMDFVGGELRVRFDRVEGGKGCINPNSIVEYLGGAFFLSQDGFYFFDGAQSTPISYGKVAETFLAEYNDSYALDMSATLDAVNSCVIWAYRLGSGVDTMLVYNYAEGRWSRAEFSAQRFVRGSNNAAMIDASGRVSYFTGGNLAAEIETSDQAPGGTSKAHVQSVRGLIDGDFTLTCSYRDGLEDTAQTQVRSSPINGYVNPRYQARYSRFKIAPSGNWTKAQGIDVDFVAGSSRK